MSLIICTNENIGTAVGDCGPLDSGYFQRVIDSENLFHPIVVKYFDVNPGDKEIFANLIGVVSKTTVNPSTEQLAAVWAFGFGTILAIWLVAYKVGQIVKMIKK